MIAALIGVVFGAGIVAGVWRRQHVRIKREHEALVVDMKREHHDLMIEKQRELDVAVTSTFVRLRDLVTEAVPEAKQAFAAAVEIESKGVKEMVQNLVERVATLNAAQQAATVRMHTASAEVMAVRQDNKDIRFMLERALTLPDDTTPAQKAMFLARIRAALDTPPDAPKTPEVTHGEA